MKSLHKKEMIEMEEKIIKIIEEFNDKINNYYDIFNIMNNSVSRNFFGTDIDLKSFYEIYKKSCYFKAETEEDYIINEKIIYSLIDIILLNIMINEIDRIDNIGINAFEVDNEFNNLYNLSKSLNLINKTRILWERIMNFSYLIFERKELEVGKSKKTKFEKWFINKNFIFFQELYNFICVFDEKYRTPENHKSSYLRKLFLNNELSPISGISLRILTSFNNEVYQNILRVLSGETIVLITWRKVKDLNSQKIPEEFNKLPNWAKKLCEISNIDENNVEQLQIAFDIKKSTYLGLENK